MTYVTGASDKTHGSPGLNNPIVEVQNDEPGMQTREERTMSEGNGNSQHGAAKEFKPRLIFWEVTKGCNLRCIHCRATATELMSPADLPTAKALDIIRQIASSAIRSWC